MMLRTFIDRIQAGKANSFTYASGGTEGLVSTWKYEDMLILTWEECPAGKQYDESTYTRDERHQFATVDEVLTFLRQNGLKPESFTP